MACVEQCRAKNQVDYPLARSSLGRSITLARSTDDQSKDIKGSLEAIVADDAGTRAFAAAHTSVADFDDVRRRQLASLPNCVGSLLTSFTVCPRQHQNKGTTWVLLIDHT